MVLHLSEELGVLAVPLLLVRSDPPLSGQLLQLWVTAERAESEIIFLTKTRFCQSFRNTQGVEYRTTGIYTGIQIQFSPVSFPGAWEYNYIQGIELCSTYNSFTYTYEL